MSGNKLNSLRIFPFLGTEDWIATMANGYGVNCTPSSTELDSCMIMSRQFGGIEIVQVRVAWQTLTPLSTARTRDDSDYLYYKMIKRGTLDIRFDNRETRLGAGSLLIVDPFQPFHESFTEPTELMLLRIPRRALRERAIRDSIAGFHVPNASVPDVIAVREYLSFIERHLDSVSGEFAEQIVNFCLDSMEIPLRNIASTSKQRRMTANKAVVKKTMLRLIGDPEIGVQRIAQELKISPSQLTRIFKDESTTPMRYFWGLRVHRAAQMIKDTLIRQLSMKEVSFRCGFVSESHFSRLFKKQYNMSPTKYRDILLERLGQKSVNDPE